MASSSKDSSFFKQNMSVIVKSLVLSNIPKGDLRLELYHKYVHLGIRRLLRNQTTPFKINLKDIGQKVDDLAEKAFQLGLKQLNVHLYDFVCDLPYEPYMFANLVLVLCLENISATASQLEKSEDRLLIYDEDEEETSSITNETISKSDSIFSDQDVGVIVKQRPQQNRNIESFKDPLLKRYDTIFSQIEPPKPVRSYRVMCEKDFQQDFETSYNYKMKWAQARPNENDFARIFQQYLTKKKASNACRLGIIPQHCLLREILLMFVCPKTCCFFNVKKNKISINENATTPNTSWMAHRLYINEHFIPAMQMMMHLKEYLRNAQLATLTMSVFNANEFHNVDSYLKYLNYFNKYYLKCIQIISELDQTMISLANDLQQSSQKEHQFTLIGLRRNLKDVQEIIRFLYDINQNFLNIQIEKWPDNMRILYMIIICHKINDAYANQNQNCVFMELLIEFNMLATKCYSELLDGWRNDRNFTQNHQNFDNKLNEFIPNDIIEMISASKMKTIMVNYWRDINLPLSLLYKLNCMDLLIESNKDVFKKTLYEEVQYKLMKYFCQAHQNDNCYINDMNRMKSIFHSLPFNNLVLETLYNCLIERSNCINEFAIKTLLLYNKQTKDINSLLSNNNDTNNKKFRISEKCEFVLELKNIHYIYLLNDKIIKNSKFFNKFFSLLNYNCEKQAQMCSLKLQNLIKNYLMIEKEQITIQMDQIKSTQKRTPHMNPECNENEGMKMFENLQLFSLNYKMPDVYSTLIDIKDFNYLNEIFRFLMKFRKCESMLNSINSMTPWIFNRIYFHNESQNLTKASRTFQQIYDLHKLLTNHLNRWLLYLFDFGFNHQLFESLLNAIQTCCKVNHIKCFYRKYIDKLRIRYFLYKDHSILKTHLNIYFNLIQHFCDLWRKYIKVINWQFKQIEKLKKFTKSFEHLKDFDFLNHIKNQNGLRLNINTIINEKKTQDKRNEFDFKQIINMIDVLKKTLSTKDQEVIEMNSLDGSQSLSNELDNQIINKEIFYILSILYLQETEAKDNKSSLDISKPEKSTKKTTTTNPKNNVSNSPSAPPTNTTPISAQTNNKRNNNEDCKKYTYNKFQIPIIKLPEIVTDQFDETMQPKRNIFQYKESLMNKNKQENRKSLAIWHIQNSNKTLNLLPPPPPDKRNDQFESFHKRKQEKNFLLNANNHIKNGVIIKPKLVNPKEIPKTTTPNAYIPKLSLDWLQKLQLATGIRPVYVKSMALKPQNFIKSLRELQTQQQENTPNDVAKSKGKNLNVYQMNHKINSKSPSNRARLEFKARINNIIRKLHEPNVDFRSKIPVCKSLYGKSLKLLPKYIPVKDETNDDFFNYRKADRIKYIARAQREILTEKSNKNRYRDSDRDRKVEPPLPKKIFHNIVSNQTISKLLKNSSETKLKVTPAAAPNKPQKSKNFSSSKRKKAKETINDQLKNNKNEFCSKSEDSDEIKVKSLLNINPCQKKSINNLKTPDALSSSSTSNNNEASKRKAMKLESNCLKQNYQVNSKCSTIQNDLRATAYANQSYSSDSANEYKTRSLFACEYQRIYQEKCVRKDLKRYHLKTLSVARLGPKNIENDRQISKKPTSFSYVTESELNDVFREKQASEHTLKRKVSNQTLHENIADEQEDEHEDEREPRKPSSDLDHLLKLLHKTFQKNSIDLKAKAEDVHNSYVNVHHLDEFSDLNRNVKELIVRFHDWSLQLANILEQIYHKCPTEEIKFLKSMFAYETFMSQKCFTAY